MSIQLREFAEHYSLLALVLAAGLMGIILFRVNLAVEYVVIWALSFMYVLWGILHHTIRKDLTGFIVLEYILIGMVAGIIVTAVVALK
jgi:hypothetical protein